jgi:hypothetical protein
MNRDEYNKLFHKVGLNRVAFKAVNDCDEEILVLVNEVIAREREWQGLTDEEIGMLTVFDGLHHVEVPLLAVFARAIEAKLKEKNT